jgi:hypothetical protein
MLHWTSHACRHDNNLLICLQTLRPQGCRPGLPGVLHTNGGAQPPACRPLTRALADSSRRRSVVLPDQLLLTSFVDHYDDLMTSPTQQHTTQWACSQQAPTVRHHVSTSCHTRLPGIPPPSPQACWYNLQTGTSGTRCCAETLPLQLPGAAGCRGPVAAASRLTGSSSEPMGVAASAPGMRLAAGVDLTCLTLAAFLLQGLWPMCNHQQSNSTAGGVGTAHGRPNTPGMACKVPLQWLRHAQGSTAAWRGQAVQQGRVVGHGPCIALARYLNRGCMWFLLHTPSTPSTTNMCRQSGCAAVRCLW